MRRCIRVNYIPYLIVFPMNQLINKSKTMPHKALHLAMGLCMMGLFACAGNSDKRTTPGAGSGSDTAAEAARDTSIKLPSGFSAGTVAESLGRARHIVVAPNGAIFVKLARLKNGK